MVTFGLVMLHCYITSEFLYHSRILKPHHVGMKLYKAFPYLMYPAGLIGVVGVYLSKSSSLTRGLDKKYTPIWIDLSAK